MQELRELALRGDGRDRAFVDANLRMSASGPERDEIAALVRASAARAHSELRGRIASGALRGAALRRIFDEVPIFERDHFVEEVLGVAYPPFDEKPLEPELIAYIPSGYDEIVHAFDATGLGSGDRFFDVGAGTGKVVLLAALLAGAKGAGIERDPALVDLARAAAADLGLRDLRFDHGDAREMPTVEADVVFMYLPFTGKTLVTVLARLASSGARWLCAGALDGHPELAPSGPAQSWLRVYRWR